MLYIGIDEAGYGPILGPLCHGYAVFDIEDTGSIPDLWSLLHPAVSKATRNAPAGAILIDDSKKLHSPKNGYGALERSVRAMLDCAFPPASSGTVSLDELLPEFDRDGLLQDPWHRAEAPRRTENTRADTEAVASAMRDRHVKLVALGARATSVRRFNTLIESGMNKADASWSVVTEILEDVCGLCNGGEHIVIALDRQGGRRSYGAQLKRCFPNSLLARVTETEHDSQYIFGESWRNIYVGVYVGGDSLHLPIALASLAAKLTREKCMERLNAFFRQQQPDLKPTAGYYTDGLRFLSETRELRERLGISDGAFVRAR